MKKVSILFIANSFGDDTIMYMPIIAKEFGIELTAKVLYIGGCPVENHINNINGKRPVYEYRNVTEDFNNIETQYDFVANDAIKEREWDIISIQQASHRSGIVDGLANVQELLDLVKENALGNPLFMWNMTWPYATYSTHPSFPLFDNNTDKMYEGIVDNVKQFIVPNKEIKYINKIGPAIMEAHKLLDEHILYRDGFHLSFQPGRYLASLCALKTLFNIDLHKVEFTPEGVDENTKTAIITAVEKASQIIF